MLELRQDLRHAFRALRRRPGFTLLVALTLALGIGANTAIFTVVSSVLLKPLPYRDADRLVMVWSRWEAFDKTWVSPAELRDYREQCQTLDEVAAWGTDFNLSLTGDFEPVSLPASAVTANLFEVFGVEPVAGRVFTPEEDVPNGPDVVMIDESLWRQRFGGDRDVVGSTIQINGSAQTVVGVVPAEFKLPTEFKSRSRTLIWAPLGLDFDVTSRGNHSFLAAARLAPGAGAEDANRELAALTERWTADGLYPAEMRFGAFALPVTDEVTGDVRRSLVLLSAAVAFLLLIACANVAGLFLTRAEGRRREIAVRSAMGAGRLRLLRLLMAESALLATFGGVLGLGLAYASVKMLAALSPVNLPRMGELAVDGRVLFYALGLSLATAVVFGTVPALRASRGDLAAGLRDEGRGASAGRGRQRTRAALVVAEVAIALVLLVGTGLLIRSFAELQKIDPGFRADGVLAVDLSLPRAAYPEDADVIGFFDRLRHNVAALPGVESAAFVRVLPLDSTIGDAGIDVEGIVEEEGGYNPKGDWQVVSPGYFETLGLALVRGRFFTDADRADSQPVAAINERMAELYWPGEDALGRRFKVGREEQWRTVVGIVGDLRHNGIRAEIKEKFYIPDSQFGAVYGVRRAMTLVARTAVGPASLAGPIRAEVRRLDADLPVIDVRTLDDVMAATVAEPRFTTLLMTTFAALALVLAAVGIYGVLSYAVGTRTREIGIRMALGAERGAVRRMVLGQGLRLTVAGAVLGLAAAALMARWIESLLYGVAPLDAVTFAAVPAVLLAAALAAIYLPARRATRVDPMRALHHE